MGERLTAEREAFVRACVSEIARPDFDAADHIIVELLAELDAVRAERDEALKAAEEREGDMHARVRAGYDRAIADAWRAKVAEVTARAERAEALGAVGVAAQIRKLLDDGLLNPQHVIHVDAAGRHWSPEEVLADPGMIAQMAEAMTRSLILAAAEDNGLRARAERAEALAAEERERAYGYRDLYRRCGLACGETQDEQPIHAVERVVRERDEAIARAERAEAGLAAVREAAGEVRALETCTEDRSNGFRFRYAHERTEAIEAAKGTLDVALADTAAAAEAYTREAAVEIDRGEIPGRDSSWLRARAAEIRGGR